MEKIYNIDQIKMNKKSKILLLSILMSLTGLTLILIGTSKTCDQNELLKKINKYHSFDEGGADFKYIYIINFISVPCRPLIYYEMIKDKEVIFYLPRDYSENDLNNFKWSLGIAPHHMVLYIPRELSDTIKPCLKDKQENLLMQVDYPEKIDAIWRF